MAQQPVKATPATVAKIAKKPQPPAQPEAEPIADQHGEFTPELIAQFHAAREAITAQIQALLIEGQSASDEDEQAYEQLHEQVAQLSRQRGSLAVGSAQVRQVLEQAQEQREQHERERHAIPAQAQGASGTAQPAAAGTQSANAQPAGAQTSTA